MIFIVLAHVDPPGILFQLRSFDVVSLVVISVMCMKETNGVKAYFSSVWKRVKRLLIPTYICIVIVLLATLLVCLLTKTQYPYGLSEIISSFFLIDGIGYIWIVRILLSIAVFFPLLSRISKLPSAVVFIALPVLLILSKILYMNMPENRLLYFLIYYGLLYSVGYFSIAVTALIIKNYNKKQLGIFALISLCFLIVYKAVLFFCFGESPFELEKHPPMLDWILYGLIVTSLLLIALRGRRFDPESRLIKLIIWFSKNSFRFYFAHIFVLKAISLINMVTGESILDNWGLKFAVVFIISLIGTYLYGIAANRLKVRMCQKTTV